MQISLDNLLGTKLLILPIHLFKVQVIKSTVVDSLSNAMGTRSFYGPVCDCYIVALHADSNRKT